MSEENLQVVQPAFDAFSRGDMPAMLELVDPSVVFTPLPGTPDVLVRRGKGGKRREVGMDRWAWEQLEPWLTFRATLPVGAVFCVLRGLTRGRPCSPAGIRAQLRDAARAAGVRRRFAPHQLRHAHAVEMSREGVPVVVIQRQLGHADLAITSAYLRGIDNAEIIHAVHERPVPMIPATSRLTPTP
jgi:site-specific recombinase XerD